MESVPAAIAEDAGVISFDGIGDDAGILQRTRRRAVVARGDVEWLMDITDEVHNPADRMLLRVTRRLARRLEHGDRAAQGSVSTRRTPCF
jgi:hypothetical protein